MIKFAYGRLGDHKEILSLLASSMDSIRKTLLDVGSVDNPWTRDFVTATFDLQETRQPAIQHFRGNLNSPQGWDAIRRYTAEHGKFSYSVCAHTLEDIAYPLLALQWLPEVSEAGFISMPSHFQELKRNIEGPWRGYIHHRWMYKPDGDKLLLIPKVPCIEHLDLPSECPPERTELQIYWEGSIPFHVLNDDYLGPNVGCVVEMYRSELR